MMEINSVGEASCSVKNPEGDLSVLARMKEEISNINIVVSSETVDRKTAFIFPNCGTVEEVCVGHYDLGGGHYDPKSKRELKLQCLAHLIKQSGKDLEEYWNRMRPLEQEVRKCYDYPEHYRSDKILEMVILDGCFILEFFRQFFILLRCKTIIEDHPIAQMERRKLPIIFRDLLQLGNQFPYMILEGLFEICYPLFLLESDIPFSFRKEKLLNIIGTVFLDALGVGLDYVSHFWEFGFEGLKPVHLLDLIRLCFVSPHLGKQDLPGGLPKWNYTWKFTLHDDNIPCISKLHLGGVKVNLQNQDHYLKVAFQDGIIKMPRIILNELMCSFLYNCVMFEHQYKGALKRISSYVLLLDSLVDTADDIDYLRQRRVLEHRKKTDAEAADFINELGTQINLDGIDPNFFKLCSDINKYYESESRKKWVSFKREYFEKPWLLISVFTGFVLLILSCLQTHYTMHPCL